uniref:Odorant binding protein 1 n=1 Tax=Chrysopa pallens TaxID=417485 RepID=A0A0R8P0J5_CHRPA|nr:odorant binding protein 1 [Chrysopa pallens]
MMKVYTTLFCVLVSMLVVHGFSDEDKAKIREMLMEVGKECVEQEKVSPEDVEIIKSHKMPESHNGLCFYKCLLEGFNVMKAGKLSKEGLIAAAKTIIGEDQAKLDKINAVTDHCSEVVGAGDPDPCVTAKLIVSCTHENRDKLGLDVMAL